MEKNWSVGPTENEGQPECKKIQDYLYRFADLLGTGNFSKVYKGINQVTNKQVAIKIIELSSLTNKRVQQLLNTETKILKMISHKNIIGCEEILTSARNCYIITELCNEGDLDKKLKRLGQIKQKDVFSIAVDVYEGLKYLQRKHIIHRDIKVSNIFISNGMHKIADFGFAQIAQAEFKDVSVGSPMYMSPEGYINNKYGPKTDVWAFGVMLYQLIEGRTPCQQCRTEAELKQRLLKQIDYSSFTSSSSQQLKSLIIQCLSINPNSRISLQEIQGTEWMKKAYSFLKEDENKKEKQSEINLKEEIIEKLRRKTGEINRKLEQFPSANTLATTSESSKQEANKKYSHKFNNFIKSNEKHDSEERKRHSTQEKSLKTISHNDSNDGKLANETSKLFYSPKNFTESFEKLKPYSPNANRFDTINFKFNGKNSQNLTPKVPKFQNMNWSSNIPQKDEEFDQCKQILHEKSPSNEESKLRKFTERFEKYYKQKDRKNSNLTAFNQTADFKDLHYQKEEQKDKKLTQNESSNNLLSFYSNSTTPLNNKKPGFSISDQLSKLREKRQEYNENRVFKPANGLNFGNRQKHFEKENCSKIVSKISTEASQAVSQKGNKIINRLLKFGDCISLIHYCRLCYKFACLLEQSGDKNQESSFLIHWAVQLLLQLSNKVESAEIVFNNQSSLMNNPSGFSNPENEKKKKLKDVTEEYLNKYSNLLKQYSHKQNVSLKEASSFIYGLYLGKGHDYKQKCKDKKQHYSAILCYVSLLDKQTRNLMEFVYEIKGSLDGRNIEKLLGIKISEFNKRNIQDILYENSQNFCRQGSNL